MTKTQIDRLGDRLKRGEVRDDDLSLLDQYRRSFSDAHEIVVTAIRKQLGLEPTGRRAKSTTSIADKLRRESVRLSQVQDVAGCRLIVSDVEDQDRTVQSIRELFPDCEMVDRRVRPSHGYRAVHLIPVIQAKSVEIQVRTLLQHLWAELSEKLADVFDPAIKYGAGTEEIQSMLSRASALVAGQEAVEKDLADVMALAARLGPEGAEVREEIRQNRERHGDNVRSIVDLLAGTIALLPRKGPI